MHELLKAPLLDRKVTGNIMFW